MLFQGWAEEGCHDRQGSSGQMELFCENILNATEFQGENWVKVIGETGTRPLSGAADVWIKLCVR